ncbi:MAG: PrsW family intramembrane metalloprotease [Propionibacteriaceae bacterium]|jgi:RsiW-degrading membrane proteinase PrsW (M82 family)|nr:PrsW family intramembrane metalloprotease [Propionibacteriaceae bacterium]
MSDLPTVPPRIRSYQRRRAGVPLASDRPWRQRLLTPWIPAVAAIIAVEVFSLSWMMRYLMADTTQADGTVVPGFSGDAIRLAATYALPTLAVYSLLFILADRFRPQRLGLWLLAVTWGGSAACAGALFLNEWASSRLAVTWWAPGYDQARLAIYIAPFVEETTKAVILFAIAFIARGRITSRLSGIALAGLTAVGFAFTENIVYYGQVIVYGSYSAGTGEVMSWLRDLAIQRGIFYSFGHPLFTAMTGIGLVVAVRSRSKLVRVTAPLAGYLAAVLGHMGFNTAASLLSGTQLNLVYALIMLPAVFALVLVAVFTLRRQRQLIVDRLTDYVIMGWLPATYPELFSRWWTRTKALLASLWHGSPWATLQLQSTISELVYLRDASGRGVVDDGGLWREHELVDRVHRLRSQHAVENPRGLRPYFWRRRTNQIGWASPLGLPTGGVASHQASAMVRAGTPARSSLGSAVDPRWGPPG